MKKILCAVLAGCLGITSLVGASAVAAETAELPEKYDSREMGIIPAVRDQGLAGTCWAFSAIAAAEANILKNKLYDDVDTLDLLESQLAYAFYNRKDDPLYNSTGDWNRTRGNYNYLDSGGDIRATSFFLSQGLSPFHKNASVPYTEWVNYEHAAYRMKNALFLPSDIETIKRAVIEYGAVVMYYYSDSITERENPYFYEARLSDTFAHGVAIVGYDDTVPKEKFAPHEPKQDGAWIVRNSWGPDACDGGYFYMSYDYTPKMGAVTAYEYMAGDSYDYNYFYDGTGGMATRESDTGTMRAAAVFEAKKGTEEYGEYVTGVSVGVYGNNVDCTVKIYQDVKDPADPESGTPMRGKEGKLSVDYSGVYTVMLDQPVEVKKGTKFGVVVTVSSEKKETCGVYIASRQQRGAFYAEEHAQPNQTFLDFGDGWIDTYTCGDPDGTYNRTARVKALTVLEKRTEPTEPTEPETEPVKPTEPETEPVKPTEPETEPVKPTEPETEPVKPTEPETEPVKPTEPETEPVKPTEPETEPVKPTEPETEPVKPTEPETEPVKPTEPETPVTESTAPERPEAGSSGQQEKQEHENPDGLRTGDRITDKKTGAEYTILKTASGRENGRAEYTASTKKNAKSVRIPDKVVLNGQTYNVTRIGRNACKGMKKLKRVTIGEQVTVIRKNAFYGCRSLKKITVKSMQLKKVEKNAWKGIYRKAQIKVPENRIQKYKKLMQNRGQKSTVRITR